MPGKQRKLELVACFSQRREQRPKCNITERVYGVVIETTMLERHETTNMSKDHNYAQYENQCNV